MACLKVLYIFWNFVYKVWTLPTTYIYQLVICQTIIISFRNVSENYELRLMLKWCRDVLFKKVDSFLVSVTHFKYIDHWQIILPSIINTSIFYTKKIKPFYLMSYRTTLNGLWVPIYWLRVIKIIQKRLQSYLFLDTFLSSR